MKSLIILAGIAGLVNSGIFARISMLFNKKILKDGFKFSSYQENRGGWWTCEIGYGIANSVNNLLTVGVIANAILAIIFFVFFAH